MFARPLIDSLDFARNGGKISDEIPVTEMPRLLDALENSQGILRYSVNGDVDRYGNALLDVTIDGSCQLCCQRCMGELVHKVRLQVRLMLRNQAALDVLEDEEDEPDSILVDSELDVLELLEDEVLLSLPIAPKHELGVCQAAGSESLQENEQNPFAVLEKLKVVK